MVGLPAKNGGFQYDFNFAANLLEVNINSIIYSNVFESEISYIKIASYMTNYTKMFNHKIGIFSPYLNTLSGGERYVASIAECFSKKPNQVDLLWQDKEIKNKLIWP